MTLNEGKAGHRGIAEFFRPGTRRLNNNSPYTGESSRTDNFEQESRIKQEALTY